MEKEKKLSNRDIADILDQIALILELKGDNPFKARAYANAARIILDLGEDLGDLIGRGELKSIRGIGEALSKKISELFGTGQLAYYNELKTSVPQDHLKMLRVRGLGPKKILLLHQALNINTIEELEAACKEDLLLSIRGFGPKVQEKILNGIEQLRIHGDRRLYPDVIGEARRILSYLESGRAAHGAFSLAGSLRRKCAIIRDINLVGAVDRPSEAADLFASYPGATRVLEKGDCRCVALLGSDLQAELKIVRPEEFPFALNFLTGSADHQAALREWAARRGMLLTARGLSAGGPVACPDEEGLYAALGLTFIPPELRENTGEIEAAALGRLPGLIGPEDIRGIFHVHSRYSDGTDTIETLAAAANQLGLGYIGIADHSRSAYYARGLSLEAIRRQHEEIDHLNSLGHRIRILKGIELEILPDGRLDYDEETLESFDFIVAAVHTHFSMPEPEMTARIIRALEHPRVTMLAHPSGRLLLSREPYAADMSRIIAAAAKNGKVLELNAHPYRLDLDWRFCKVAKSLGVKIAVNPDAHQSAGLLDLQYGIDHARKGWLEPTDCLNTLPLDRILSFLNKK